MTTPCKLLCRTFKEKRPQIFQGILKTKGRTNPFQMNGPYEKGKKYCKMCQVWMYVNEESFLSILQPDQREWVSKGRCPCCHAKLRNARHSHRRMNAHITKRKRIIPEDQIKKREIVYFTSHDHGQMAFAECLKKFSLLDKKSKPRLMILKFVEGFKRYYHLDCGRLISVGV